MNKFAYGVDFGWVSQLESMGIHWVDEAGTLIDPYVAAKRLGADSVRLRVFVDPPKSAYWQKRDGTVCMLGFCDPMSVLVAAKRVKQNGMRLMLDVHYSDHFADPEYQEIPSDWLMDNDVMLEQRVRLHTLKLLWMLKSEGITPEWIQIGNEINPGILLPYGSLSEHPKDLVRFLNAGFEAVKEVDPAIQVMIHLSRLYDSKETEPFLDNFFENGGKTDILAFSYYPYWAELETREKTGEPYTHSKESVKERINRIYNTYQKPVMIAEIGGYESEPEETRGFIQDTIEVLKELPGDNGRGIFYWEPEVNSAVLPDGYPLGAAELVSENTLRFTDALSVYSEQA